MSKPSEPASVAYFNEYLSDCQEFEDRNSLQEWAITNSPEGGVAIEFGVGWAESLTRFAEHRLTYGFDSFQGLPEDWRPGWPKGTFRGAPIPHIPNTKIVNGWFEDTVPDFMEPKLLWTPPKVAFVHIDCDLYSSTVTALKIAPLLMDKAIILFDEYWNYEGWELHEHRALMESNIQFDYVAFVNEEIAIRVKK